MYYPEDKLEEVRAANDIVDVVGTYVHLKKQGANYFGLCPFHNEKSPSFSVSPSKQIFYCFGCGAGGNVITFLMKYENCTFQEAARSLADRAGIRLPEADYGEEQKALEEKRKKLFAINKETATYYYRLLRQPRGEAGMRYFTERKLTPETMKSFGLGFSDGSASDLVKHLRSLGYSDELILESGVAAHDEKRGLHDKFWNRVMFPIFDVNSRVIGFGGRVMGDGKPKYLNSPETDIFNKRRNLYGLNAARRSRSTSFILCEGYMDVIAMHQAGFTQAVASLGTSFTEEQAAVLKRYAREIILSYDSDAAGTGAALRNAGILKRAGLRARVLNLKPSKDPDEFIKTFGAEAFRKRLDEAENVFFFELRMAEREFNLSDPSGRTDFLDRAARMLGGFEDELERESYTDAVAAKYFVDPELLRRKVGAYEGSGEKIPEPMSRPKPLPSGNVRKNSAEDQDLKMQSYLLTWMGNDPEVFSQVSEYVRPEHFSEGVPRQAASRFYELAGRDPGSRGKGFDLSSVMECFPDAEQQSAAAGLFNVELHVPETPEEQEKALRDLVLKVRQSAASRETGRAADADALADVIRNKKELDALSRVKFHLKGTERGGPEGTPQ